MRTFNELGLNPRILASLARLNFTEPTPIQREAIPFIIKSRQDLIALAQTGTGKTAAFGLPILDRIDRKRRGLQALILCPTRELCLQIAGDIRAFAGNGADVAIGAVYGGESIGAQIKTLKSGCQIVVGTPGRAHDLIRRKALDLRAIEWLVLDEADEMLDRGFKDDLDAILREIPAARQTLLFSATMSKSVRHIAGQYMKGAHEIRVGGDNSSAEKISHEYYLIRATDRFEALQRILDSLPDIYGILFCRTRLETQRVADLLKQNGYDAEALHGDISQAQRTKIMDRFKRRQIKVLVATDVAARGIDVSDLTHVINYSLPDQDEVYTHRTGRTGRANKHGVAISLITVRDQRRIGELEKRIGKTIEHKLLPAGIEVCRRRIAEFVNGITAMDDTGAEMEKYYPGLAEAVQDISAAELMSRVIKSRFNALIETHQRSADLNARPAHLPKTRNKAAGRMSGGVGIRINLGKKDNFGIKDLFGLINSRKGLKGMDIGQVRISTRQAVFMVDRRRAEMVKKTLNGAMYRGRKISASLSGAE